MNNEIILEFDGISANEAFARVAVAAVLNPGKPTPEGQAGGKKTAFPTGSKTPIY